MASDVEEEVETLPRESGSAAVSLKEKGKQNGVRRRGGGGNTPKSRRHFRWKTKGVRLVSLKHNTKTKWRQTSLLSLETKEREYFFSRWGTCLSFCGGRWKNIWNNTWKKPQKKIQKKNTCRQEVAFAHGTHGVFEKLENNVLEVRRNVAAGYILVPLYMYVCVCVCMYIYTYILYIYIYTYIHIYT